MLPAAQDHEEYGRPTGDDRGFVDPQEVERFDRIAAEWWDPDGKFRPLHAMNPVRAAYVRDRFSLLRAADKDEAAAPLAGLRLLDVGCGGGLLSEALARWGADVVAVDASEQAIAVARRHAAGEGLAIDYRCGTVEDIVTEEIETGSAPPFDGVASLEVVEHVPDPTAFCAYLARATRPGGRVVMSTLNRTNASYLTAIIGAEYLLGWLPRGTHDWRRFLKPSELARELRLAGLVVDEAVGMTPEDPAGRRWRLSRSNLAVNYLASAIRPARP